MKLLLVFFIILVFALFGIIQGLRTRQLNGEKTITIRNKVVSTTRLWHKIQAILHGLIAFAVSIHFGIISGVIAFLFTLVTIWIVFDLAHNLTTKQRWYYSEDVGINGTLKKKIGERGILIVKGIAFLILLFFYFFIL